MTQAIKNTKGLLKVTDLEIQNLLQLAQGNQSGRYRLCAHHSESDAIQEMLIAFSPWSRIAPHRRNRGIKSYYILYGEMDVYFFDNNGKCIDLAIMSHDKPKTTKYLRLSYNYYMMPVPGNNGAIIHEVSTGPFTLGEDQYLKEFNSMSSTQLTETLTKIKRKFQKDV